jgi:hypothetical protein
VHFMIKRSSGATQNEGVLAGTALDTSFAGMIYLWEERTFLVRIITLSFRSASAGVVGRLFVIGVAAAS